MKKTLFLLMMLSLSMTVFAQKSSDSKTMKPGQGFEINLWPEGPRTSNGDPEDVAKVTVFLPNEKRATGRAIVCCPGGGYSHLAMEHEGLQWAPFFNEQGIALIVLKYRMPHGAYQVPAEDAEAAIRLVREHADEWHINADDVGIMGFSAGGHLSSHLHGAGRHP